LAGATDPSAEFTSFWEPVMLVFLPLLFSAPIFLSPPPLTEDFCFLRPPPSYYGESYTKSPSVEISILSVLKLIKTKNYSNN
jgi:hypothetical protein